MKKIFFALSLIFSVSVFAAPREVMMIRHYDAQGKLISFQDLKNQYPVSSNVMWRESLNI